jgi:predicted metal-dependent enzyme (double-stranded beta helix superfamily)
MLDILVAAGQLASAGLVFYGALLLLVSSKSVASLNRVLWAGGILHTPHSHRVDLFGERHPELEW